VQFASVESKGFCHYKCTPCIKQHLAVDTSQLAVFDPLPKASVTSATAKLNLYSMGLMLKRLANDIESKWVLSESQRE
jgi:hypothetical protein